MLASFAFLAGGKEAAALTVTEVRENMTPKEQTRYVAGVVEGLAFARWIADGRDNAGMNCIWGWYFGEDQAALFAKQSAFFDKHPDQQVSTLMYALIREECGE